MKNMKTKRDMKAEEKVFNFLLDQAGEKYHLSQVSQSSLVSNSTVHLVLERLTKKGIVQKNKLGNLSQFSLDLNDPLIRQKKVVRTIEILKPLIERLKDISRKIVLFGSGAEGTNTAKSDIDLFILTDQKAEVEKVISQIKLPKKLQAIIKNDLEFVEMKQKSKFFYQEIERGKVLWEESYE